MTARFFSRRCPSRVRDTWTPPFPQALASDAEQYAEQVSVWGAWWRRLRRELVLAWHGQGSFLRCRIDVAHHRRILWIHQGTPQVGDSLMDLAARVLLAGRAEQVDLLTEPGLLPLYRNDQVFTRVAADPKDLPGPYDLVLLHSASSRCVRNKLAHYRTVPFVHIHGYFTGPEFNRTLFGFYRLAQLLQLPLTECELNTIARPVMSSSADDERVVDQLHLPDGAIAVALGGVRDWRTYHQWPQVMRGLRDAGLVGPVVLVGSDNALAMRDEVLAAATGMQVIDQVARLDLGQVHALLRRCALVMCSDGGLLHVAHAADVAAVALFAGIIDPSFRVTAANRTRCLYGAQCVDQVPVADVVGCAVAAMAEWAQRQEPGRSAQPDTPP